MCWVLARWAAAHLVEWSSTNGRGPRYTRSEKRTSWSFPGTPEGQPAFSLLNERAAEGRPTYLRDGDAAAYVHVDDGVVITTRSSAPPLCDRWASLCVRALNRCVFVVPDCERDGSVNKVLGYQPRQRPAALTLTPERSANLAQALWFLSERTHIDLVQLRAVVGVWIWGALLNRF